MPDIGHSIGVQVNVQQVKTIRGTNTNVANRIDVVRLRCFACLVNTIVVIDVRFRGEIVRIRITIWQAYRSSITTCQRQMRVDSQRVELIRTQWIIP